MAGVETTDTASVVDRLVTRVGTPPAGRPGLLLSTPGSGKTVLLLHLAHRALASGHRVIVLSLGTTLAKLRAQTDVVASVRPDELSDAEIGRRRLLMVLPHTHAPASWFVQVQALIESGAFVPDRLVFDGLPAKREAIDTLAALSARFSLPVWASISLEEDDAAPAWLEVAGPVLRLRGEGTTLRLLDASGGALPFAMDAATGDVRALAGGLVLVHGGAAGAEAAFGEIAEEYGLQEQNFTFDGHRQGRTTGARVLTADVLRQADADLSPLLDTLGRSLAQDQVMSDVLRLIWHTVHGADQVFAVGWVQPDHTVRGGTGLAVELAKHWSRELWAFDQEQSVWLQWRDGAWIAGHPKLSGPVVCGTGTRHLSAEGYDAIKQLLCQYAQSS